MLDKDRRAAALDLSIQDACQREKAKMRGKVD